MDVPFVTLRRAVTLIDELAELADPAGFAGIVLPGLSELVGCDVATYNEIGPTRIRYADYPAGALNPASRAVFAAYVHQHPLVNHYRATGNAAPMRISDLLTREQFHRLGLYAEFFRHVPAEHQLAITLSTPGSPVIGVALNRARTDFTDSERELLGVLRGPLLAALARARARQHAHATLTGSPEAALGELTDRERQILQFVALGHTNISIAHALGVSPRTVAKHLEHIYRKLDVTNRAAAAHHTPTE